ncbi:HNH endonuclease signature motif containing protein [Amphibacillus jilinensis]|uniref:HNH endonuclease n=1 Tax=Amphibacillus jilinensis TaxID=1216008 RepID=UPI0030B9214A
MRNVFYKSWMWQKKRDTVLERDGYLCQVCLRADEPVPADTVHHIVHLKDNPSLALVDTNLISVCFPCHNDLHPEKGFGMKNEKKFSNKIKVFEVNQNPEQPW